MSAAADRPLARKLFEPASIEEQAPAAKVLTYALLLLWALVVLVPLYWVLITSFKGPGEVDNGPFYMRWLSEFASDPQGEGRLGGVNRGLGELLATGNLHRPWFNWMIPYRLKRPSG